MIWTTPSRMSKFFLSAVLSCLPLVSMAGASDCDSCPPTDCQGCRNVGYAKPGGTTSPARGDMHSTRLAPRACDHDAAPSGWFHPGDALYLRNNFPDFYDIVTMNSPKSHANNGLCIKGMLCFSALANMDYRFYNRNGNATQPGSAYGVSVRPLFREVNGLEGRDHSGSINNIDLFIDGAVNKWVNMHIDLVYANASVKAKNYKHFEVDYDSIYHPAAALKVNEAYFLLANPACTPFFVQIGRIHAPFGDYEPFPITESLTQLISEIRTGGVVVGAVFQNGVYASANYTMNHLSFGERNAAYRSAAFGWDPSKDKNWGGMVGYRGAWDDECNCRHIYFNANASYIADIRDSIYLTCAYDYFSNYDFRDVAPPFFSNLVEGNAYLMQRVGGVALHGTFEYNNFGLSADYVSATGRLNPKNAKSQVCAWGINGYVHFPIFCRHSKLELGYQHAQDSDVFFVEAVQASSTNSNNFIGPVLPHYRFTGTYGVELMDHITGSIHFVVDRDNCEEDNGTELSSYMIAVRLSAEL